MSFLPFTPFCAVTDGQQQPGFPNTAIDSRAALLVGLRPAFHAVYVGRHPLSLHSPDLEEEATKID